MRHQRVTSGLRLVPVLLVALCMVASLPTLATDIIRETIHSNSYEVLLFNEPSLMICLTLLEGGGNFDAKLRLELVSKSEADKTYLSGNANVTKELLQNVSGTPQLTYEYINEDQNVDLKITLSGKRLPYTFYNDYSSDQYGFHAVKFYVMGDVEVTEDCPKVTTTTTTTPTTTTPTTTTTTTTTYPHNHHLSTSTTTLTTHTTIIPIPTTTTIKKESISTSTASLPIKTQEIQNTQLLDHNSDENQSGVSTESTSGLVIGLVVGGVLLMVGVVVVGVVIRRRKIRSARPDQLHAAELVPLDQPPKASPIQVSNVDSLNPVYRPTTQAIG